VLELPPASTFSVFEVNVYQVEAVPVPSCSVNYIIWRETEMFSYIPSLATGEGAWTTVSRVHVRNYELETLRHSAAGGDLNGGVLGL